MAATALFAWELGGGWGHLGRMAPVAQRLRERGLETAFALQQLDRAASAVGRTALFQAPLLRRAAQGVSPMYSVADILHNAGGGEPDGLSVILGAWRSLYEAVRPSVLVADYAPFALAASRGLGMRRVVLSNGFDAPPASSPMPPFRGVPAERTEEVAERERHVLQSFNRALEAIGAPPLARLADAWHEVDRLALVTLPELDAYPDREQGEYWGIWGRLPRAASPPRWPSGKGPRVFAYLKGFDRVGALLDKLDRSRCRTVAYVSDAEPAVYERTDRRVRVVSSPVNIDEAVATADAFVNHAGAGTMTAFLLAGKPGLCLPLQMEQTLTARRAAAMGSCVGADPEDASALDAAVDRLLDRLPALTEAARAFADRYADFDPLQQCALLGDAIAHGAA